MAMNGPPEEGNTAQVWQTDYALHMEAQNSHLPAPGQLSVPPRPTSENPSFPKTRIAAFPSNLLK